MKKKSSKPGLRCAGDFYDFAACICASAETAPASGFEDDLASANVSVAITKYTGTAKMWNSGITIERLPASELMGTFSEGKTIESVVVPGTVKKPTHGKSYDTNYVVFDTRTSLKSVVLPKNVEAWEYVPLMGVLLWKQ